MSRLLEVSTSGFYAWSERAESVRARSGRALLVDTKAAHHASRGVYGSPRVPRELLAQGHTVGRDHIGRVMRENGLLGRCKRRFRNTTQSHHRHPAAPNVLEREFTVEQPNAAWVGDITYLWTQEGWLYLAVILDLYSRRVVGWAMGNRIDEALTLRALGMALNACEPDSGLIHHTDRGSQGGFNRSSQHFNIGGVVWDDHEVGRLNRLVGNRCVSPGRPGVNQRDTKRAFWERINLGMSSEDAALACGVSQPVGTRWFRQAGGMAPTNLAPDSGRYLSFTEREELALLRAQGHGVREIACRLGRSPSTISRELRRNVATRSGTLEYRATVAQWKAERAAKRPKSAKLATNDRLQTYVQSRLAGAVTDADGRLIPGPSVPWRGRRHGRRADRRWGVSWSPEQISRRLRIDFPDDETMRISHEAIYQAQYIQGRGALRRELSACLRTGRALRVPRARKSQQGKHFISSELMISERPAEVCDRAVPGHWEGDLIIGLNSSAIGTLVERTSRFTLLLHLPPMPDHGAGARVKNGPALAGHGAEAVRDAIRIKIAMLPEQLRKSLTWDQGAELAQHAQLRIDTGLAIYFCDPRSPWQRGTNENTNGLLRQYFPKGTDISRYSEHEIDTVAATLNNRPRKTLNWKTPAEALNKLLPFVQEASVATTP